MTATTHNPPEEPCWVSCLRENFMSSSYGEELETGPAARSGTAPVPHPTDGLLIAVLALFVPRRRTVTAIRIGKQLIRAGELWALNIPPEDTKNEQALDFPISADLSRRIDVYLQGFRVRLPSADSHGGLWASNKRGPMSKSAIYDAVRRRTKKAFGFGVNLHQFRHAAGSFWSIQDPVNVRGVKDLMGHASYDKTTEKYYVMSQLRLAGRALAEALDTHARRK